MYGVEGIAYLSIEVDRIDVVEKKNPELNGNQYGSEVTSGEKKEVHRRKLEEGGIHREGHRSSSK